MNASSLVVIAGLTLAAAPAPQWAAAMWNPRPDLADLVLPLPCGGGMAFGPVDVPAGNGPLDDRGVTLGIADSSLGFNEYLRLGFLAAPFPGPAAGRRYYIGKYHVTRDQFGAISGATCQPPTLPGRVPQTQISWQEAANAAATWSAWLLANARDMLPRRGSVFAYARLPTEEEWEYAARGGSKVSEEEFLGRLWPMREGIERYAMSGTRLTAGKLQPIGELLPNPLGLYDMLGNASQMMLDPYRLNRVGRLHGGAGGIAVRGGDYTSPPASLHTAIRTEIPPFDAASNGPTRLATMGFRLVLSATSVGSLAEIQLASTEFEQVSGAAREALEDPKRLIDALKQQTGDPDVRDGLDRLSGTLTSNERARQDAARTALGAQMQAAAILAQNVWSLQANARVQEQLAELPLMAERRPAILQRAERVRRDAAGSLEGYMRLLRQIAATGDLEGVAAQAGIVQHEMNERAQGHLVVLLQLLLRQSTSASGGTLPASEQVQQEILAIPSDRATK